MTSSSALLQALLRLDEQADRADLRAFADGLGVEVLTRFAWRIDRLVASLTERELVKLVKVFTRLELCVPGFCGGSTERVSLLLHELSRRDPEIAEELAAWAFHTTRNPYVPFGTQNYIRATSGSLSELRRRTSERLEQVTAEEAGRLAEAKKRREARKLAHAERVEQQRDNNLRRLADLKLVGELSSALRLRHIALDQSHSPYYYPQEWAAASAEVVAELSPDVVKLLRARLVSPPRGPWRALARRLEAVQEVAW